MLINVCPDNINMFLFWNNWSKQDVNKPVAADCDKMLQKKKG